MFASIGNDAFDDDNWLFEIKWDGYRAIAEIENKEVNLYSRNNISFNDKFKPLVESLSFIDHNVILDGEIVSVDDNGVSKFQLHRTFKRPRKEIYSIIFLI